MPIHFQREIDRLNKMILQLGGQVEENVRLGILSVQTRDVGQGEAINQTEFTIDELEIDVEEECLKLLALHQPVAADLRYIIAILKINNDLERIGDLAANMGRRVELMARHSAVEMPPQVVPMGEFTRHMLRQALNALISQSVDSCRKVLRQDHTVDQLNSEVYDLVKAQLRQRPQDVSNLLNILLTAKDLERIADHACNIAEDIIYLVTGEIVRHHHGTDD